ncbi:hypothetical protein [Noviherbaspirillum pedocola]|uniref:DUF4375 domain-containing protein n=1 Tax=Noviherbaspirillum pedocola TaxID=2801341 RepID=A0A934SYH6_9BURK|nr:hypothetical protein [Noviherbaspirillum pedocola]MBK4737361.1 hypothetical protein [Noviherbaspirillum pedocola]
MRIYFKAVSQVEAICRRVASTAEIPMRRARSATAAMMGYKDWAELKEITEAGVDRPSLPDEICTTEVVQSRVLYQVARLAHAIAIDEETAARAISHIRPTTAFFLPYLESDSPTAMLFPRQWTGSSEWRKDSDRFIAEIGGTVQRDTLAELACGKEEGAAILDPATGVRVMAAYTGEPRDGLEPGDPFAVLALRFVPVVQEQVLTHIEIRLLTFMCAEDISEEGLDFVASAVISYLNQPVIHWQCSGNVSGAAEGIQLSLHGIIGSDEERTFVEALDAMLCECEARWQKMEGCSVTSTERLAQLPLAAFDNYIEDFFEPDDSVQPITEPAIEDVTAVYDLVCSAMQQAPARLCEYLGAHGKSDYADFAQAHHVATPEGIRLFLEFVQAMEHARALPAEVAVFIQNHFITTGVANAEGMEGFLHETGEMQGDLEKTLSEMNQRHADKAAALDCREMEKHYRETPPARLADIVFAGQAAFLGNVEAR